jgi:hypothetical protein
MAANEYFNVLRAGVQSGYNAIATKDPNVLYFCTDTKKIYKGDVDFTESVVFAATKPQTPIVGKVYVLTDTKTVEVFNGTAWTVVSYPMATTIDADSNDTHVASAKAVFDFVGAEIAKIATSDKTVSAIANKSGSDATLTITKADNTTSDLTINGVVTTPTWNTTTRTLTLPVAGGTAVEVAIGKDIFVDPTADNKYDPTDQSIHLHLNDGTEIVIPAASLIDVYTGAESTSATVTVDENNAITATVKLAAGNNNEIKVAQNGGLIVDLTTLRATVAANTTAAAAAQADADAAQAAADAAQADADTANGAIATLNGDSATEGSVAYAVAAAQETLQSAINSNTSAIATLNGDNTTAGSVAKTVKDAVDALNISGLASRVTDNETNIAALAAATTAWGTF